MLGTRPLTAEGREGDRRPDGSVHLDQVESKKVECLHSFTKFTIHLLERVPMGLLHKSLNTIGIEDIELLKLNSVQEWKQIDYKLNLVDDSKFLSSVCSFANCMGGDLVFGISEEKGIPTSCPGLLVPDFDAEVNRLENMIRDGIEPRITGMAFHRVATTEGRTIIVIRIPRSWSMPHRVKKTRRFFSRHSAGKYDLICQKSGAHSAFLTPCWKG